MMRVILVFIMLILFSPPISAQTNTIDDRVIGNEKSPLIVQRNDPLSYDKNLLILRKPKLFTAYATPSVQYTDNAFLSPSNRNSDFVTSFTSGVDFNLKMQRNIGVNAGISASRYDYKDNSNLGYNSFQGNLGISTQYKNWTGLITYAPTVVFEKDFDNRSITLNRFSAMGIKNKVYWSRLLFSSYAATHYIKSNPDEFSYLQFDSGIRALYPINDKWRISINPHLYQKTYDDFFEDQTGGQRSDIGIRLGTNLSFTPKENMNFSLSLNYVRNKSSLDSSNYTVRSAAPAVRFSYRF